MLAITRILAYFIILPLLVHIEFIETFLPLNLDIESLEEFKLLYTLYRNVFYDIWLSFDYLSFVKGFKP